MASIMKATAKAVMTREAYRREAKWGVEGR
jgi:hypothetical protein